MRILGEGYKDDEADDDIVSEEVTGYAEWVNYNYKDNEHLSRENDLESKEDQSNSESWAGTTPVCPIKWCIGD